MQPRKGAAEYSDMSVTTEHYMRDLGLLLKENAREARSAAKSAEGTPEHGFELGRSFAYYEVLSLMREQAAASLCRSRRLRLSGDCSLDTAVSGSPPPSG